MVRKFLKVHGVLGVPDYHVFEFATKIHRVALVIPILNEKPRILEQLKKIRILGPEVDVIIVDGGSTDGIEKDLQSAEFNVSALLIKTGKGKLSAQLRVAFQYCLKKEYESVITMDGNGKDGVEGINTIKKALDRNYDFVQGSRFIKGGKSHNTPITRYLAIRFLHAPIISIAAKFWYTDTTNGFRGHSIKFIGAKEVNLFRDIFDSYELLAYLPIRARRLGYCVTEVPVRRTYPATGKIPTKIKGINGQVLVLRILIGAACRKYN